eukprot:gene25695-32182_t
MNAVNIQLANNLALSHPSNCNSDGLRFDAICSRVSVQNSFAIYDTDSIDQITGNPKEDPTPWLEVEAVVVDESNFKTNEYDRSLQLLITCPDTGTVYQSVSRSGSHGDYTPSKRSSGRLSDRLSGRFILGDLVNWIGTGPRTPSPLPNPNAHNNSFHSFNGTPERNSSTHKHHSHGSHGSINISHLGPTHHTPRDRTMSGSEQVQTYSSPNTASYSVYNSKDRDKESNGIGFTASTDSQEIDFKSGGMSDLRANRY